MEPKGAIWKTVPPPLYCRCLWNLAPQLFLYLTYYRIQLSTWKKSHPLIFDFPLPQPLSSPASHLLISVCLSPHAYCHSLNAFPHHSFCSNSSTTSQQLPISSSSAADSPSCLPSNSPTNTDSSNCPDSSPS